LKRPSDKLFHAKARRVSLFVVGMLILRAMIPAGFMLTPVPGGLAFTLCDVETPMGAHAHHAGHDHSHMGSGPGGCPYAQSSGPAPLPTLPTLAHAALASRSASSAAVTQTRLHFGPIRETSSRGPPLHS
jgi:hypothetical protein